MRELSFVCFTLNEFEGISFLHVFFVVEQIENIFKLSSLFFYKNCFIVLEVILCDLIYY